MMQITLPTQSPTHSLNRHSTLNNQRPSPRGTARGLLLLPAVLALAACAIGPNYHRPTTVTMPMFKENQGWKPATPREVSAGQPWWSIYNDPVLDGLEQQVQVSNQTLKASEAAFRAAQAAVGIDTGSYFPDITATGSVTRSGGVSQSGASVGAAGGARRTLYDAGAQASWSLDVWGRIRRTVESDVARAQASAADVAAARLSAQVALAEDYFQLRSAEQQMRMYKEYLGDLENALSITQNQVRAGITTLADVYAAQTQLENTQVSDTNVRLKRATFEHAIAVLIGKAPSQLSLAEGDFTTTIPVLPAGVPSDLLERRPDIAAAERNVASQNALIGVAESAWFPDLTLSASVGYVSTGLAGLLTAGNSLWSVGPALAETVFNGGARRAQNRQARALYDESVANYRQTVLSAFQSVEDDLVTLRVLEQSDELQVTAVGAARSSEQLTLNQYKAGIVAYSSVITAQTTRLTSEISLLAIQSQQLVSSVDLVSQLGGGWEASQLKLADRGVPAH